MSSLPSRPHLRHLRNEAKDLLKGLAAGDAPSAERIAANLPRLGGATPDAVLADDVTLQEVQHVLAKEYGFTAWTDLCAAVDGDGWPFPELEPLSKPLEQLTIDEVKTVCRGLSRFVKATGESVHVIPPGQFYRDLEDLGNRAAPSVGEFIRLAADGTHSETIAKMAQQRGDTVARNRDVRWRLMLEGALAIARSEPPRLLAHRLDTIGQGDNQGSLAKFDEGVTLAALQERLAEAPVSTLKHADLAAVLVGCASVAKERGVEALAGIVDRIDEPLLRDAMAMAMVVEGADADQIVAVLEPRLRDEVARLQRPFAPFGAGFAAALEGASEEEIEAAVDGAGVIEASPARLGIST